MLTHPSKAIKSFIRQPLRFQTCNATVKIPTKIKIEGINICRIEGIFWNPLNPSFSIITIDNHNAIMPKQPKHPLIFSLFSTLIFIPHNGFGNRKPQKQQGHGNILSLLNSLISFKFTPQMIKQAGIYLEHIQPFLDSDVRVTTVIGSSDFITFSMRTLNFN